MKINTCEVPAFSQPTVGNVYPINGGYGRRAGHAMVLLAVTEKQTALLLVIDRNGDPVGVTSYGIHVLEERAAVAFVPGLADLTFQMEPLS